MGHKKSQRKNPRFKRLTPEVSPKRSVCQQAHTSPLRLLGEARAPWRQQPLPHWLRAQRESKRVLVFYEFFPTDTGSTCHDCHPNISVMMSDTPGADRRCMAALTHPAVLCWRAEGAWSPAVWRGNRTSFTLWRLPLWVESRVVWARSGAPASLGLEPGSATQNLTWGNY